MSDFAVGCFGKLPIYPDFIRYNASNPEIAWLDQWFQEGIQSSKAKLGQGWAETFSKAEPWNFLFHPDDSGHFLIGIFIPSRDQGGRLYPFFLFMRIDHAGFHVPGYFAPAYFSSFLDDAWNMAHGGWKDMDMKTFLSAVEGMCVRIDGDSAATRERYLRHLQDNSVKGFWEDVYGDFGNPRKYLITRNLNDILEPMRNNPSNKFGLGLKFPIMGMQSGETFDIPLWFDMISRFLRQDKLRPLFFWNRRPSDNKPCMITFLSRPSPKSYLFFIRPDMDCDYWYDPAPDNAKEIERVLKILSKEQKDLLDNEALSLASFLNAVETFAE